MGFPTLVRFRDGTSTSLQQEVKVHGGGEVVIPVVRCVFDLLIFSVGHGGLGAEICPKVGGCYFFTVASPFKEGDRTLTNYKINMPFKILS